jgi:hypothetical protein
VHQVAWVLSFISTYQAIQGRFPKQENSVYRVHSYQQLSDKDQVSQLMTINQTIAVKAMKLKGILTKFIL